MLGLTDLKISLYTTTKGGFGGTALSLDFLSGVLDSRITFSRGTNATLIDSTGRLTYAPNNTVTNSVGPSASTGTAVATVSGAAPDGSNAIRLSKTDATTPRYSSWTTSFTVQGNTGYVASAYFKYDGFNTTVSLEYNNVTHFGTAWVATFNVTASGITANAPSACTSGVQAVGNGWFRVWAAFTSGTPSVPTSPTFLTQITGGAGTSVLVAWGQLEQVTYQTTPSTYNATTASAYYGPRFDYDPVTLAPRGLLIEEARTNLLTYSDDWSNAAWAKSAATVTANNTASPDGTVNADKLVENTATSTHSASQGFSGTSGTSYTFSLYAKAAERNWIAVQFSSAIFADALSRTAYVNLATGAIGTLSNAPIVTVTNAANGWRRVTITVTATATSASAAVFIYLANADNSASYLGDGASGVYLYGAQLEAGSFATSYIPTVASTVTRNADVATMTGTNFSSWYNQSEGTFVTGFDIFATTGSTKTPLATNDGTANNFNMFYVFNTAIAYAEIRSGAVIQATLGVGSVTPNLPTVGAFVYKANDFAATRDGLPVSTDTSGVVPLSQNTMSIGYANQYGGLYLNGHIRTIAYFNTRLPNAQLQTLTAPSLATTLHVDFTSGSYLVGF